MKKGNFMTYTITIINNTGNQIAIHQDFYSWTPQSTNIEIMRCNGNSQTCKVITDCTDNCYYKITGLTATFTSTKPQIEGANGWLTVGSVSMLWTDEEWCSTCDGITNACNYECKGYACSLTISSQ